MLLLFCFHVLISGENRAKKKKGDLKKGEEEEEEGLNSWAFTVQMFTVPSVV